MNGRVVSCNSINFLHPDDFAASNIGEIRKCAQFDEAITAKLGNSFFLPPMETSTTLNGRPKYGYYDHSMHTPYEDEIESPTTAPEDDLIYVVRKHVNQQSVTDIQINVYLKGRSRVWEMSFFEWSTNMVS